MPCPWGVVSVGASFPVISADPEKVRAGTRKKGIFK
jgi:hypothetical protein